MKSTFCFALVALCGICFNSASADIVWNPSVNMYDGTTNQNFVSTNGTGLVAYNGTANLAHNPTVNGVVFTGALAGTTVTGSSTETITVTANNDHATAFEDGEFTSDADIDNLIQGAHWQASSVTLGGLQIGQQYEIQFFGNDARSSRSLNFLMGLGDGSGDDLATQIAGGTVGELQLNNSPADGSAPTFPETEAGDYIIGTFVADATSLTFQTWGTNSGVLANATQGSSQSHVNGIQLRNITAAVPEPGSLALICIGAIGLVTRRRR